MVEWWACLPWQFRLGFSLLLLLISTVLWFYGQFWPWGWIMGSILFMFSFPNDAEKRGYHDF